ncbi:hypothetical protein C5167_041851 [Papaver somniferum]|uniref:paramyosin-like n=1 Tax=Papaver somniferum TaxID=3469 RepID=UPI000E701BA0|nr:paramyosin-like [Papaver somniferum]XP_026442486.1 paramyosin-like [Papaver somniferum]XP_026442487.1 paramyosin-like [Papaver somniferum]XP_026442488.1 paramyosin-like [Papaver somniferum]XP_026442489.1 paramyosin-like [Papaver somniferum]XP_026442490.1 paramyosin-like [Papaver somniferum]RZC92508.1 hypothetical protein C5167_041851 [Papaver somniferum]
MATGDDNSDSVLSDVEGDDPVPIVLDTHSSSKESVVSIERFQEVVSELDRERKAREVAEKAKSELQVSFNRLKALTHEAIKKRDESVRQRDEAVREKEEALSSNEKTLKELEEVVRLKDELLKQRDESAQELDDVVKARDSTRSEIEASTQLLVTGIEKISGKVSNFKIFSVGGLPRSQKYSGLPAVAYGIIKRTNEIVEELLKQIDTATKSRNDAREQIDHRNYEIAIEVSQLEAAISGLREEVAAKASGIENLEKSLSDKEIMVSEMNEKLNVADKEVGELKQLVNDYDGKLNNLESKMESQRPLQSEQLKYISNIHEQLYEIIKIVDENKLDHSDLSHSMFLPQMDMDENLRASLAGMESISELIKITMEKVRNQLEVKGREAKDLNETVARLVKEKSHIGTLLRSVLSRKMKLDPLSKTSEVLQVAENGLREAGLDVRFTCLYGNGDKMDSHGKQAAEEIEEDEVYTLAGALEKIVNASQLEIIDLHHSVEELSSQSNQLKAQVEAQERELSQRKLLIEELKEKESMANQSVEDLMMDIAAAEEEIARWKVAAEQEAAAGRSVEQEFLAQLSVLRQELDEMKQTMLESDKKLKFKEETAAAAMAARDAAEKSLRLADLRASRLRERLEELSQQIEESDTREDSRNWTRQRYACWPWQWLGMNYVGYQQPETQQQNSNEMELAEPLI